MSFIFVDIKSRVPIYEQIINSVKEAVLSGYLSPDESLPSVRALAGELAINPNTIQKAYSELERQGIVYSLPGRGSFISTNIGEIEKQHRAEIIAQLKKDIKASFAAGISEMDIVEIFKNIKEETENDQH